MIQNPGISRRRFLQATVAASAASSLLAQNAVESPAFIRTPNIQNLSPNGGSIVWTLANLVAAAAVVVDGAGKTITAAASVMAFPAALTGLPQDYYQYTATVAGLKPGSVYSYQVQANGQTVPSGLTRPSEFITPGAGAFNFVQFADSGEGNAEQLALRLQMLKEPAALALANGDLAYDLATYTSVEANYYGVYQELMSQIPFFATLGNHEYMIGNGLPSLAGRVTPTAGVPAKDLGRYYSFDWGNAHFVALDSNQPLVDAISGTGQMLNWLEADLQNTRKFWKIVFFHHPGYATGVHQNEPPAAQVREAIVPILEKYGVQLVFNGHEHTYQRTHELLAGQAVAPNSGGIVYVTSGGGGAEAYYTAPNDVIAESIGVNNYVFGRVSGSEVTLMVRGLGKRGEIDSLVLAPHPQIFSVVSSTSSYTAGSASGGGLTVIGRNLSPVAFDSTSGVAPAMEHQCSATLNGVPLPILSADAEQMNFQLPPNFTGFGTLMILTGNGAAQAAIQV